MSFWGMSQQGKDAQNSLTNLPKRFDEQAALNWGRSNEEFQGGQGVRNEFLAYIREMIANGVGDPNEILALAEQIMPGVSEAIGNRNARTERLRGQAGGIPNASQVRDEISGVTDEFGNSILNDSNNTGGDIRDTFTRQTGRADQFGKDRTSNIRDVYSGANEFTHGQQKEMLGDVDTAYTDLTRGTKDTFGGLRGESDPAFAEMMKRIEAFKPGGEARASRVGRSFNPAYASTVARLRKGGVDLTSPEAIASLTRIDTARANSMDDSLADDTERYVGASNETALKRLANNQGLAIGELDRVTGLGTDKLNTGLNLKGKYGDIIRQLGLDQGKEFRDELTRQEETGRGLDLARLDANTKLTRETGARLDKYFQQRMSIPQIARELGLQDFEVQRMLEDRANTDDLTGIQLKSDQFDKGMNYRLTDLARKDSGADRLGGTGQQMINDSMRWSGIGSDNAAAAGRGYADTFGRESANAGWGTKLIGAVGGAAADYFLPGSGSIVRSVTGASGGGGRGGGNSGALAGIFSSIKNKVTGGGGSSNNTAYNLPLKTGSPINPYGGYQAPKLYAEGGVVDETTMGIIGETGEREYIVPESKTDQFSAATLATGAPPDPSMLPGQLDRMDGMPPPSPPPPPKPTKLQIKKLDERIKAEQSINKSWDERIRDAMKMGKLMNPESEPDAASANPKAMKMKHKSDSKLEQLLDLKTSMLEASVA